MSEKRNVMCSMCEFEIEKKCTKKKNIGVHINKKRSCGDYSEDTGKVDAMVSKRLSSQKPVVTFRPDWYWDKKGFIKKLKEEEKRIEESIPSIFTGDPAHPLTGDLSRFVKSTVGEGEN